MNDSTIVNVNGMEVRGLAPRQAETLAHTALGLSAKETARVMSISHRTVEMNLNLVMSRLGARNRVHMITQAIAAGALIIKQSNAVIALCLLMVLATLPTPNHTPDDLMRLTARSVRIRRPGEGLNPIVPAAA